MNFCNQLINSDFPKDLIEGIKKSQVVNITNVYEWYMKELGKGTDYVEEDLITPFENTVLTFEADYKSKKIEALVYLSRETKYGIYEEKYFIITGEIFIKYNDVILSVGTFEITINEDGTLWSQQPYLGNNVFDKLFIKKIYKTAKISIMIMNDSNTSIYKHESKNSNRVYKVKNPINKYYTLEIKTKQISIPSFNASNGSNNSLHMCRGHFRNYKDGKGLFGKYHGVYWVEGHVRGDEENGKVEKDYKIVI